MMIAKAAPTPPLIFAGPARPPAAAATPLPQPPYPGTFGTHSTPTPTPHRPQGHWADSSVPAPFSSYLTAAAFVASPLSPPPVFSLLTTHRIRIAMPAICQRPHAPRATPPLRRPCGGPLAASPQARRARFWSVLPLFSSLGPSSPLFVFCPDSLLPAAPVPLGSRDHFFGSGHVSAAHRGAGRRPRQWAASQAGCGACLRPPPSPKGAAGRARGRLAAGIPCLAVLRRRFFRLRRRRSQTQRASLFLVVPP